MVGMDEDEANSWGLWKFSRHTLWCKAALVQLFDEASASVGLQNPQVEHEYQHYEQ